MTDPNTLLGLLAAGEAEHAALLAHANEVHALDRRCTRDDLAGVLAAEAAGGSERLAR